MKLLHVFFIVKCAFLQRPKYCVNCFIHKDDNFLVTGKVKEAADYQYCSVVREYTCGEEGII